MLQLILPQALGNGNGYRCGDERQKSLQERNLSELSSEYLKEDRENLSVDGYLYKGRRHTHTHTGAHAKESQLLQTFGQSLLSPTKRTWWGWGEALILQSDDLLCKRHMQKCPLLPNPNADFLFSHYLFSRCTLKKSFRMKTKFRGKKHFGHPAKQYNYSFTLTFCSD